MEVDLQFLATSAAALMTASVGIWQFAIVQGQANKRPFLEKQLELCFEATDTVATLATETDPDSWEAARRTFWRLYYGRLHIVEDKAVEQVMVRLGQAVPVDAKRPMHCL